MKKLYIIFFLFFGIYQISAQDNVFSYTVSDNIVTQNEENTKSLNLNRVLLDQIISENLNDFFESEVVVDGSFDDSLEGEDGCLRGDEIREVHGEFAVGDTILVRSEDGTRLAKATANYSSCLLNFIADNEQSEFSEKMQDSIGPIISEKDGIIKYEDIIDGFSARETLDPLTGISHRAIIDWKLNPKSKDLKPQIKLVDQKGNTVKTTKNKEVKYFLPIDAVLNVSKGTNLKSLYPRHNEIPYGLYLTLPNLLGLDFVQSDQIQIILQGIWLELGNFNYHTATIGLISMIIIIISRRINKKIPNALIVVVLGILTMKFFGQSFNDVAIVKEIPSGLPFFGVPEFEIDQIKNFIN